MADGQFSVEKGVVFHCTDNFDQFSSMIPQKKACFGQKWAILMHNFQTLSSVFVLRLGVNQDNFEEFRASREAALFEPV